MGARPSECRQAGRCGVSEMVMQISPDQDQPTKRWMADESKLVIMREFAFHSLSEVISQRTSDRRIGTGPLPDTIDIHCITSFGNNVCKTMSHCGTGCFVCDNSEKESKRLIDDWIYSHETTEWNNKRIGVKLRHKRWSKKANLMKTYDHFL